MNFTWIDLTVVIVYLVAMLGLGIWQASKIKNTGDFFAGGRGFNKFLMMMHSLGTGTHADDPAVVAGASFKFGLAGIWYTFVYLFVTPFFWLMAPLFRRSRYLTTADFFEARFGRGLGLLYAIMGVLTFTINMGTLLKGTGTIATAVTAGKVPELAAILGMTAVFLVYGSLGGLLATVITEAVQGLLIVVMSFLLIPFGLAAIGGFSGLHKAAGEGMFNLHSAAVMAEVTIPWIIAGTIANLIGIVAQPHIMEVCSTGKTEFEGRVGFTYGTFIKRFCAIAWAFTGVIMFAMVSSGKIPALGHREGAFGTAIRTFLPSGFTGLMFAAILAAQMSTLSAFMVAGSALISRNLYQRYINPAASDKQILLLARFAGLAIVALGLLFALFVGNLAEAYTFFWGVSTLTGLFMWFGVLWKRTNSMGAWMSFIIMSLIWIYLGPIGKKLQPFLPQLYMLGAYGTPAKLPYLLLSYLPVGAVALVMGSLFGKRVDQKKLDHFYLLLSTPVGREDQLIEAGVDIVYAGNTTGHPWELKYPKLVNWGGFAIAAALSVAILGLLVVLSRIGA